MDFLSFLIGFVTGVVFLIVTARYVVGSGTLEKLEKSLRDEEEQDLNMKLYVEMIYKGTYGIYRHCDSKFLGTVKSFEDFNRIVEEHNLSPDANFVSNPDYYSFLENIVMNVGEKNG